jgi:hypothetical protein
VQPIGLEPMPPGFPGALPLSYDRGLRSAEHETHSVRSRQPGLNEPGHKAERRERACT